MECNRYLTLHFSISILKFINNMYLISQKMFLFDILEAISAYDFVKIRFIHEKEVILNENANNKSR